MSIVGNIVRKHPELKHKLYMAGIRQTPEEYVKQKVMGSFWMALMVGVLVFLMVDKQGGNPVVALFAFGFVYLMLHALLMKQADIKISKRAKRIDKDVLFAGRFLLVKLNSGRPLINALEDATKSYGVSNEYFKEIMRDVNLGTPLEQALEKATQDCPSAKLKKILFQITNALKIGTDVTNFLDAILDDIADQQLIEIQRYGKKLNSLTMFYMLFAVVLPSLGMTMIVIVISLVNLNIGGADFLLIIGGLIFMQYIFLNLFRSIRPNVHI